jgi:hypothetical protein
VILQGTGNRLQTRPGAFLDGPGKQHITKLEHQVPVGLAIASGRELVMEDDVVGH